MRKIFTIFTLSFTSGILCLSFFAYANQTSITNYYPSPSGNYAKVYLKNQGGTATSSFCTAALAGTIFADKTTGSLEVCKSDGSVASYPGSCFNRFGPTGTTPSCPSNYQVETSASPNFGTAIVSWSCCFTGQGATATPVNKSGCFSIYSTAPSTPNSCYSQDSNAYDVGCDVISSTDMSEPVYKRNCCFNNTTGDYPLGTAAADISPCNCVANCAGAACGLTDNGCGGPCNSGTCVVGDTCESGVCQVNCQGTDASCGGTPGACTVCTASQTCVASVCQGNCLDTDASCGTPGACAACSASDTCVGNVCTANCLGTDASCGNPGSCVACTASETCVGTSCLANCADTDASCGSPGSCAACSASESCVANVCTLNPCGDDAASCGSPGSCAACGAPNTCVANVCTPPTPCLGTAASCGSPGSCAACGAPNECISNVCTACACNPTGCETTSGTDSCTGAACVATAVPCDCSINMTYQVAAVNDPTGLGGAACSVFGKCTTTVNNASASICAAAGVNLTGVSDSEAGCGNPGTPSSLCNPDFSDTEPNQCCTGSYTCTGGDPATACYASSGGTCCGLDETYSCGGVCLCCPWGEFVTFDIYAGWICE